MVRSAKPQFSHTLIRASAGSGKTFQLTNRYLALLHAEVAPDCILATTFTRKAAGEILDRIVQRLAEAAFDPQQAARLGKEIGAPSLTCPRVRELLQRLLRDLHRLQIGTLDSFFARVARSLSLEIGLPLDWQIVDELEDLRLRDEAVTVVIDQQQTTQLLTLTHLLSKGETLRSVSQLIRSTVTQLAAIYYQADASIWRILTRPRELEPEQLEELLESLRELELPTDQLRKIRDNDLLAVAAEDWEEIIRKGVAAKVLAGEEKFGQTRLPPAAVQLYSRLLTQARAKLVVRVANLTEGACDLLEQFDAAYQKLKQSRAAVRFDDVTRRLAQRFSDSAAGDPQTHESLALRLDSQIEHLLLDEFQDTAPQQWQVLRPFAQRVTTSDCGSFFCVGDGKQAIYGWRGGVAEIFEAIDRQLPALASDSLNVSYRSAPPVIAAVNQIFHSLSKFPAEGSKLAAIEAWVEGFQEHHTARDDLEGYVCLETAHEDQNTLELAAERVAELHRARPQCSIGVLVRLNETVSQMIALLRRREIVASQEGGIPLTHSAAVQLILSLLQIADHPQDTVARFHAATSPVGPPLELIDHQDDAAAQRFSLQARRALLHAGYGATVAGWARLLESHVDEREQASLAQLVELAYDYQPQATLRPSDFIRFVENTRVAAPVSAAVRVMTIHQAKGLQFDIVVLPELDGRLLGQADHVVFEREEPGGPLTAVCRYVNADVQKLLPPRFQRMFAAAEQRHLTEALCVLYVALTRAIHALYLLIAPSKHNERTIPFSSAGLLRVALDAPQPAPAGAILFETGKRRWRTPVEATPAAPLREPEPIPEQVTLAPLIAGRQRGWEWQSPSSQEGGSLVYLPSILRTGGAHARCRGTILHAWLQSITWLDEGVPKEPELRQTATSLLIEMGATLDIGQLLADFREVLDFPQTRRLLSRDSYLETLPTRRKLRAQALQFVVETERAFAVRHAEQLLGGSIDRLVSIRRGDELVAADVIDFKTDSLQNQRQLRQKTEFYRPQLEAYCTAVSLMTGLPRERISARLLFVSTGRLVTV